MQQYQMQYQQPKFDTGSEQSASRHSLADASGQSRQDSEDERPAKRSKKAKSPTKFEIQDEAIKTALAENTIVEKRADPEPTSTWSEMPSSTAPSKLKSIASTTGKLIGRSAAIALPTVGLFFLNRAMNQSYMNNLIRAGGH